MMGPFHHPGRSWMPRSGPCWHRFGPISLGLLVAALVGCGTGPFPRPTGAAPRVDSTGARPQILTVGVLNSIAGYGPWNFNITGGGANSVAEIHTVGLVSED